jgi:hypothetical protein
MTKQDQLEKDSEDAVLAGLKATSKLSYTAKLNALYTAKTDAYFMTDCGSATGCQAMTNLTGSADLLPSTSITKVIVCGTDKCGLTLNS